VNGAAGAGVNVALACDLADRRAFGQFHPGILHRPHARRRWHVLPAAPGWHGDGLALLGDKPRARSREWGLIWKCVDDAEFAHRGRCSRNR
jgi:2-(1,2-epoxy-1,2-dihydrophenyl)acetyl-CoA isomerase